jgi:fatty acid desaturase
MTGCSRTINLTLRSCMLPVAGSLLWCGVPHDGKRHLKRKRPTTRMKYLLTQVHFVAYIVTMLLSHVYLTRGMNAWAIPMGWALFGLSSIGHDCLHYSFHPSKRVNTIVACLCLDCLALSSTTWHRIHNQIHHTELKGPRDIMHLHGASMAAELAHVLTGLARASNDASIRTYAYRVPFWAMLLQYQALSIVAIWGVWFGCIGYLTYITHSYSSPSEHCDRNAVAYKLLNSWDVLPTSHLANLLSGGINIHATHHVFPHLTRYECMLQCDRLRVYPEYRRIESWMGVYRLYRNRTRTCTVPTNDDVRILSPEIGRY